MFLFLLRQACQDKPAASYFSWFFQKGNFVIYKYSPTKRGRDGPQWRDRICFTFSSNAMAFFQWDIRQARYSDPPGINKKIKRSRITPNSVFISPSLNQKRS
jgi:hypothetical protein